jgi:hypothetical protein
MFLSLGIALAAAVTAVSALGPPTNIPECGTACYISGLVENGLADADEETHCRSAPFQLSLCACAAHGCDYEDYTTVCYMLIDKLI